MASSRLGKRTPAPVQSKRDTQEEGRIPVLGPGRLVEVGSRAQHTTYLSASSLCSQADKQKLYIGSNIQQDAALCDHILKVVR